MRYFYQHIIKNIFDRLFALIALIVASPFMIIIAILLYLTKHRPVFFTQQRPGYKEKVFLLYKFKTMTDEKDASGILLPDAKRLTSFGKFLRKTSLDELPQLLNVVKGEMSFVGPRPLLVQYLPLYNKRQRTRHLVKPGITGWAQVNGRNAISWQQKFEYDAWYVEHQSLWLDIKILFLTVLRVVQRKDISQYGEATAAPFTGN
jgi:lipopolysaccharide/colanic/teichoic acid biosynthesis glycosyltransferase